MKLLRPIPIQVALDGKISTSINTLRYSKINLGGYTNKVEIQQAGPSICEEVTRLKELALD